MVWEGPNFQEHQGRARIRTIAQNLTPAHSQSTQIQWLAISAENVLAYGNNNKRTSPCSTRNLRPRGWERRRGWCGTCGTCHCGAEPRLLVSCSRVASRLPVLRRLHTL